MDKVTEALLAALKQALAEPAEQRLYKSGKLAGLFPGRSGSSGEAAGQALRDGLLEMVRTETKGKTVIEWVRATPRGVNFLHDHESPVQVLRELRAVLQTNRDGVPAWLSQLRQDLQAFEAQVAAETQKYLQRLDALTRRVEEALLRADAIGPIVPDGASSLPWAQDALIYLDRRRNNGAPEGCPLPELFEALRERHADLGLTAFHDGLRRLHDRRALRLLPYTGPAEQLPQPEHAILDGSDVFYFARR
jgi:hypothetical protein